ncbi:MAG: hypothetical protein ACP5E4_04490 [Candidatus Aenigmatarchaeota archaeon]
MVANYKSVGSKDMQVGTAHLEDIYNNLEAGSALIAKPSNGLSKYVLFYIHEYPESGGLALETLKILKEAQEYQTVEELLGCGEAAVRRVYDHKNPNSILGGATEWMPVIVAESLLPIPTYAPK